MNDTLKNQVTVDRVDRITCAKCGQTIDLSEVKPLTSITCPGCGATTTAPGKIGQFMITSVMGTGAMGAVFAATDTVLGRRVAIKVMRRQEGADEQKAQLNFLREARALAAVNHRNVVQVHTIGQHKGQTYIVMELVDGQQSLETDVTAGRQLDEKRALQIGRDVAEGLSVASRMRLIHGDVKPGNILLSSDGTAKVVDFGLVQRSGKSDADEPVWGTPYYVAPERVKGEPPNAATDIYSLGATLWHLLAGRPPFAGTKVKDVIMGRLKNDPPDLTEARPELSKSTVYVVMKMMARDPADRYADYDTVIDRLDTALKRLEAKAIAKASRPEIHAAKLSTTRRERSVSSRPLPRQTSAAKRRQRTLIVNVISLAIAIGAVLWMVLSGDLSNGVPPIGESMHNTDFDGPKLVEGWSGAEAGQFNGRGQYLLPAGDRAGQSNAAGCTLPVSGFECDLRLNPIEHFDVQRGRIVIAFTGDGGDGLTLSIMHDDTQRPVLRCEVTADGSVFKSADADLPYTPETMALRVRWAARFREWSVRFGQGAANPVTNHPIGRVAVPASAAAPSAFSVRVYGAAGVSPTNPANRLRAGLDEYSITPGD